MTPIVEIEHVTRHYRGGTTALDDVSTALQTDTITGLLGPQRRRQVDPDADHHRPGVRQLGHGAGRRAEPVGERRRARPDDVRQGEPDLSRTSRSSARWKRRPGSTRAGTRAGRSADGGLRAPANRPIKKLSRGMHSAVGIVIGLAARAEITLFDEPYLGLDAVARQIFYDRLLADYAEHPRTMLLSTHLIDEVANLLEHVIVIDHGRIVVDAPADDLRGRAVTVSGRAAAVDEFVAQPGRADPAGARLDGDGDHQRAAGRPGPGQGPEIGPGARPGVVAGIRRPLVGRPPGKGSAHERRRAHGQGRQTAPGGPVLLHLAGLGSDGLHLRGQPSRVRGDRPRPSRTAATPVR